MSKTTIDSIKTRFENGDMPDENAFFDLIDSCYNVNDGDGTKFLADDGNYQDISIYMSNVTSGAIHTHSNKNVLDTITSIGNANEFLSADGTYKTINVTGFVDHNHDSTYLSLASSSLFEPIGTIIKNGNGDEFLSADGTYKTLTVTGFTSTDHNHDSSYVINALDTPKISTGVIYPTSPVVGELFINQNVSSIPLSTLTIGEGLSFDINGNLVVTGNITVMSNDIASSGVVFTLSGYKGNSSDITQIGSVLGITTSSTSIGALTQIQTLGTYEDPSYNFTPYSPLFFDTIGRLTHVAPSSGYIQQVGIALSTTKFQISIALPIKL